MLLCTWIDPLASPPPSTPAVLKGPDLLQQQKNKPRYDCLHESSAALLQEFTVI